MNKQDWFQQFEATNGRSPEAHEVEAAQLAGEFTEDIAQEHDVVEETVAPEQVEQAPVEQPAEEVQVEQQPVEEAQVESVQEPVETSSQTQATDQPNLVDSVQPAQGQPQQESTQGQFLKQVQDAVPSAVTAFLKQFWDWFLAVLKSPTKELPTNKYNGLTVLGLLVFFTTLTISTPLIKFGVMTFSSFIGAFVALSFIFFSFVLAGFVVKKVVYKDAKFTFLYSFEWFGRLLSPNVCLMAIAAVCALINLNSLSILATVASYFIFATASAYTLYHKENESQSSLDSFYKYILAGVLFSVIVSVFIMLGTTIAGEVLFNGIFGNFGGYGPGPFGY